MAKAKRGARVKGQAFQPKGREGDGRPWYIRFRDPATGRRVCERAMFIAEGQDPRPAETQAEALAALAGAVAGARRTATADEQRGCREIDLWTYAEKHYLPSFTVRETPDDRDGVCQDYHRNLERAVFLPAATWFAERAKDDPLRPASRRDFLGLHEITVDLATQYREHLKTEPGRRERVEIPGEADEQGRPKYRTKVHRMSLSTRRRHLIALGALWDAAIRAGYAIENPWRKLPREKTGRAQTFSVAYLSPADVAKIVARTDAAFRPIVGFAAETGMRRSEILRLDWSDVEPGLVGVMVRRSKSGKPRRVVLTPTAQEILRGLHDRHVVPAKGPDFVFATRPASKRHGPGVYSDEMLFKAFKRAVAAAKLPRTTRFHDLRHAVGAQMAQAGVPIPDIAEVLGDTLPVAMRYAGHSPTSAADRAFAALAAARAAAAEPAAPVRRRKAGATARPA